jgi:hypothetical protein
MSIIRPGQVIRVKNTAQSAAIEHKLIVKEDGFVGQAIKTAAADPTEGLVDPPVIKDDEEYNLVVEGVVMVPHTRTSAPTFDISAATRGTAIYITSANALSTSSSGNTLVGKVTDEPGDRGCPSTHIRIKLSTP